MREPRLLRRTVFGNPVLREVARELTPEEVRSDLVQQLITDIKHTVDKKKYGVGMAAPQVGQSIALARIAIKPTPTRPNIQVFDRIIINPKITKHIGEKVLRWEGCISFGSGDTDIPYAQTERWPEIEVSYLDENGAQQQERLDGLAAHVYQHEMDHLNGILFVDRVVDPKSYMMISEFKKRVLPTLPKED